ncbi:hypothetical protein GCM10022247_29700 [Allokutzneria multivorans]|uniref:DUF6314 domain-containing protein n=1 Tax=Allokutzneria multivorans TaxID=1142134 RepID=A0ABP7S3M9_9PSEU
MTEDPLTRSSIGTEDPTGTPEGRLFRSLRGKWALARAIPGTGSVTGTAEFRPLRPDLLLYREEGRLELGTGQHHDVSREYHYLLEHDRIRVCFVEPPEFGRTMHTLRLDGAEASDEHLCDQDLYTGHYRFDGPDRFTVDMRVRGPKKDYSMHTTYDRLPQVRADLV